MRWILLAAACASATPASAKNFSFDCDTTADRFSEIATPAAEGSVASGTVSPWVLGTGASHLATATVFLAGDTATIGLRLYAGSQQDKDSVIVSLMTYRGDKKDETVIRTLKIKDSVRFRLAWNKGGTVSLEVDDWKHSETIALGAAPAITVGCSTGEFQFGNLDFGG